MEVNITPIGLFIKEMLASRKISMSAFAEKIFLDRQLLAMLANGQYTVPKYFMLLVTKRMNLTSMEKQALAEAIAQTPEVSRTQQTEVAEETAIEVCLRELLKLEAIAKDQATFIRKLCSENEQLRSKLPKKARCSA